MQHKKCTDILDFFSSPVFLNREKHTIEIKVNILVAISSRRLIKLSTWPKADYSLAAC